MRAFWAYIEVDENLVTQKQIEEIKQQVEEIDHVIRVTVNAPTAEN